MKQIHIAVDAAQSTIQSVRNETKLLATETNRSYELVLGDRLVEVIAPGETVNRSVVLWQD